MDINLSGIDERLDKILEPTYGQLIFQEQVTEIVMALAGYDAGKADVIRKTIGRKIKAELDSLIPELLQAFQDYGKIPKDKASMIAESVQACSGYLFNKCLAGSEKIMLLDGALPLTVEEMYKVWFSDIYAKRIANKDLHIQFRNNDFGITRSIDEDGWQTDHTIKSIEFSGIREVWQVMTENGKTVKCTFNHKFPTIKGEKILAELTLGDSLLVRDGQMNYKQERIISVEYAGVENTFSVEMYDPYHTFTLSSGILSCNSHSVEYGLIAYQTAYLKANYPVEYMCSLLNANINDAEKATSYMLDCKRMGVEILPPDVMAKNILFTPENGKIRIGLSFISGITNISYCIDDNMKTVDDFFTVNDGLNKKVKENLVKSGALDCFLQPRGEMLAIALNIPNEIVLINDKVAKCKSKILDKQQELSDTKPETKKYGQIKKTINNQEETITKLQLQKQELEKLLENASEYDDAAGEMESLGFTFRDRFDKYNLHEYDAYNENKVSQQVVLVEVNEFKQIKDKNQHNMAFVKMTTPKGKQFECVMFSNFFQPLKKGNIYIVKIKNKNQLIDVAIPKVKGLN